MVFNPKEYYKKYMKDYYKKKKYKWKDYYKLNKEKCLKLHKDWRKKNKEKCNKHQKDWRKKNRKKYNKYQLEKYHKNINQNRVKMKIRSDALKKINLKDKKCMWKGCNKTTDLERHHPNYNTPEIIEIYCKKHHGIVDKKRIPLVHQKVYI